MYWEVLPGKIPIADLFCQQPTALANVTSKTMCVRSRQIPHDTSQILYRKLFHISWAIGKFQQQEGCEGPILCLKCPQGVATDFKEDIMRLSPGPLFCRLAW